MARAIRVAGEPPCGWDTQPMAPTHITKAELTRILQRAGYDNDVIGRALSELPDPVDLTTARPRLLQHAITLDEVMSRMGGSP